MSMYKDIRSLLTITPSEIIGYICIVLILGTLTVLPALWNTLGMNGVVDQLRQNPTTIFEQFQELNNQVNHSKLAADTSVFIVWAITGLLCYTLVSLLYKTLRGSVEFIENLNDIRQDKKFIINEAVHTTLIRAFAITAILGWLYAGKQFVIGFAVVSFSTIITLHIEAILFSAVSLFVLAFWLHGLVALLRLFFMKRRLFLTGYYSVEDY